MSVLLPFCATNSGYRFGFAHVKPFTKAAFMIKQFMNGILYSKRVTRDANHSQQSQFSK